jgi:hypothetical protein
VLKIKRLIDGLISGIKSEEAEFSSCPEKTFMIFLYGLNATVKNGILSPWRGWSKHSSLAVEHEEASHGDPQL